MKNDKNKIIEKEVKSFIARKAEHFPFIYQFCEIGVDQKDVVHNGRSEMVKFGHYGTEEKYSVPFYKPFSKIINFAIINE